MKKVICSLLLFSAWAYTSDKRSNLSCQAAYLSAVTSQSSREAQPTSHKADAEASQESTINSYALLPDDLWRLTDDYSGYNLHMLKTMSSLKTGHQYPQDKCIRSTAWAPDGKTFATATTDMYVRIWDATTHAKKQTLEFTPNHELIETISYSTDGQQIVSGDNKGQVRIWDAQDGKCVSNWQAQNEVKCVIFNKDDTQVLSGEGYTASNINIWDIKTEQPCASWSATNTVYDCLWLSNTSFAAVVGYSLFQLLLFDTRKPKPITIVGDSHISPEGNCIVCTSDSNTLMWLHDDRIVLCDLKNTQRLEHLQASKEFARSLSLHPDDRTILITHKDSLETYDKKSRQKLETFYQTASNSSLERASWSPTSTSVLATCYHSSQLLHFKQKSLLESLK